MLKKIRPLIFHHIILNTDRFLLLFIFSVIFLCAVNGQSKEALEAQKLKLEEQISITSTYLKKSKANKNIAEDELNTLSAQIVTRKKILLNIQKQLKENDQSILSKREELDLLHFSRTALNKNYQKLIQLAYRHKLANKNWVSLFSSKSLQDAYLKLRYANQFEKYVRQQSSRMEKLINEINGTIQKIEQTTLQKQALLKEETQSQKTLSSDLKNKNNLISSLQDQISNYQSKLKEKESERNDLNKRIASIIRKEMEAVNSKSNTKSSADRANLSEDFEVNQNKLPWPIENGILLHKFGIRTHPANANLKIKNDGIDIQARSGSSVQSIFKGVVASVSTVPGYKNIVIISTGEYFIVYGHLQTVSVENGDIIELGQNIGTLADENGKSILQLQIWKNQTKLDPQKWLEKR